MPGDRDCQNVCCQAAESCLASVGILVRTDIHKITYVAALLFHKTSHFMAYPLDFQFCGLNSKLCCVNISMQALTVYIVVRPEMCRTFSLQYTLTFNSTITLHKLRGLSSVCIYVLYTCYQVFLFPVEPEDTRQRLLFSSSIC